MIMMMTTLNDMPPLEDDEGRQKWKGLKILTPNKLLTRLSILLMQMQIHTNSKTIHRN